MNPYGRIQQCALCPWKKSVSILEIPNGPDRESVRRILMDRPCGMDPGFMMACHDSPIGEEQACVGWLVHELGPGNNIPIRIAASRGRFDPSALVLDGPQHESVESMCAPVEFPE